MNGNRFPVLTGDNKIGRDPNCEIMLESAMVSWNHAIIEASKNGVTIHDLDSRNKTKKGLLTLKPWIR